MSNAIVINGIRLDHVLMPMEPDGTGVVSSMRFPKSQIHFSLEADSLRLVLPAYLSVELYRIGVLPQDEQTSVKISIGGRAVGRYVVDSVWYPSANHGPFGRVIFTLTRVRQRSARDPGVRQEADAEPAGGGTFVTDITHYLDEACEMANMSGPARRLASFLTLLIEAATSAPSSDEHDSGIRCRTRDCRGSIRTFRPPGQEEISWHCPVFRHNGVIRNWHNTKWNQLRRTEES